MKSKQKLLAVLLTVWMAATAFAGCSKDPSKADTSKNAATQAATTAKGTTATVESAVVPFAKEFEFSILSTIWSPYKAETTLLPEIMKATNTKINMEWAPQEGFSTKVNTILASGKMPDVILGTDLPTTVSLVNQGAIIALDDLYKKYAPNIMASLKAEDYPFIRNVDDGHIYSLFQVFDFKPINSWMIRSDWLEKLNLKAPTNWDEWLKVWKAFRDNDVNGDGNPSNQIPITGEAWTLYPTFGIISSGGEFTTLPDGGYNLVYEHPNYRTFLETMSMLYKEKLLDQEFPTRVMAERYKIMDSNIGGSTLVAAEQAKLSTVALRQKDPKATCLCIAPPKGPKGDQYVTARNKIGIKGVITVTADKAKKSENIIRFFDWIFSKDGEKLLNFGVEGTHSKMVDGKPVLNSPYIDSFVNARNIGLIFQPFPFLWSKDNYMQILLTGKKYEQLDEPTKIFYDGLFLNEPYFASVPPTLVTKAYSAKSTDFMPKLKELQANTIAGRITVDQFYTEYNKLKSQGLKDIIDQAAAAWKVVNAK